MSTLLLVQMSGVPGSGKSTIAREIRMRTGTVVLDLDVRKTAVLESGVDFDSAGHVAYITVLAFARSLLDQGLSVVLDSPCRFR